MNSSPEQSGNEALGLQFVSRLAFILTLGFKTIRKLVVLSLHVLVLAMESLRDQTQTKPHDNFKRLYF